MSFLVMHGEARNFTRNRRGRAQPKGFQFLEAQRCTHEWGPCLESFFLAVMWVGFSALLLQH